MNTLSKLLIIILLAPARLFTWAYSAVKIWSWFLVDGFSVDPINYKTALGISCFVSLFLTNLSRNKNEEKDKDVAFVVDLFTRIAIPLFILFFAWIIKSIL